MLVLLLMVSGFLPCTAQTPLFRGRAASEYNFPYNGNFFWSTPEFRPGTVRFDGVTYNGVMLNINAHTGDLMVRESEFSTPVVPERSQVAWFEIDGLLYVNLRDAGIEDAPEGFFAVLQDGRSTYYWQRTKLFVREPGNHNGVRGIGYDDPRYRENIIAYFHCRDQYYCFRRGVFKKVGKHSVRRAGKAVSAPFLPSGASFSSDKGCERSVVTASPSLRNLPGQQELPAGFFSDESISSARSAALAAIEQENLIASYRNKIYEIGVPGRSEGPFKVEGVVRNVAGGAPLAAVFVSPEGGGGYDYTDADGHYSITLRKGENTLVFNEYSMEEMRIRVVVRGDGGLDVVMREKVTALKSAYVSAEGMAEHRRTAMGVEKINSGLAGHIPSAFGEADILKAVLTLPGVKTVGEASGGFNVRGGASDQNLILFNEGTIYNPSHLFGIFSAFNNDVVDGAELYKSSIPAQYGGRISSVLDINTREGDMKRIRGALGIGLLTGHLSLEGPIVKDRTSFLLGGRTSYSDWMLRRLPASSGYSGGSASFSDVNLSVTHRFDDVNSLQASGYWSRDGFSFRGDTTFRYSNLDFSLIWKHRAPEGRSWKVSAGFDRYSNSLAAGASASSRDGYNLSTVIRQGFAKASFSESLGAHNLSYGADAVFYALSPGILSPTGESLVVPRSLALETALEPSLYVSDSWTPGGGPLSLDMGVRLSSFLSFAPTKFYATPEFRLSAKYSPSGRLSFKAGLNTMSQYIHLISNTSSISPMDTWRLSGESIKPQRGWQAAAGVYWTVFGGSLDISLEGYWKRMYNILDYKSGAVLSMNEHLADDLVRADGRAYGVELMLRKQTGRLTGWIAYTWSRSLLREEEGRGAAAINGGAWYNAPHDKPHDIKLVANYKFTHRYSISCNLDYSTGRPVTIPVGQYMYCDALRLVYSERNAYRIPDYFRLDLALNIEPGHYFKALAHMSATIGCYNVTGRKNAYSVYYTTNGGTQLKGYMVSVFATPIPYATLNLKF